MYLRILRILDFYSALTTKRPYREAYSPHSAISIMLSRVGIEISSKVFSVFISHMTLYPPGSIVVLNDNMIGEVIDVNINSPLQPRVVIFGNTEGKDIAPHIIRLSIGHNFIKLAI